jgi:hypothetical protein
MVVDARDGLAYADGRVVAYPPGRPHRQALVSATVCNRADHQDTTRRWAADMAGTPEIGFGQDLASPSSGPMTGNVIKTPF